MQNNHTLQNLIAKSDVSDILDTALKGKPLGLNECIRLIKSEDFFLIGHVGNILREKLYGNTVTFVNNIILNYTNVCVTYCKFCAFYRPPGHSESYTLTLQDIIKRVTISRESFGITQVLFQGGHNPNLKIEYYETVFKEIKKKCPGVGIHGLSPSEVDMISRIEKISTKEVLAEIKSERTRFSARSRCRDS